MEIWDYYIEFHSWMPVRELYSRYGGKQKVSPYLEQFGKSLVFEMEDSSERRYKITLLGLLVSPKGGIAENILTLYIGTAKLNVLSDPKIKRISHQDFEGRYQPLHVSLAEMGRIIEISNFWKGFSVDANHLGWSAEIPDDLEDIPDNPKKMLDYIHDHAMQNYNNKEDKKSEPYQFLRASMSMPQERPVNAVEFVHSNRIEELRNLQTGDFDLSKLIRLCEEVNSSYNQENWFATLMLIRAIMDHIPPIFQKRNFQEIASNYSGTRSFKQSMQHLDQTARSVADGYLHIHIREKESLPNKNQVNFSPDIDALLAEVVRILRM